MKQLIQRYGLAVLLYVNALIILTGLLAPRS